VGEGGGEEEELKGMRVGGEKEEGWREKEGGRRRGRMVGQ
jgi:hypothetical protein